MKNQAPYRAVAVDLDGTLLDYNGNLPNENIQALQKSAEAGWRIVVASGRMTETMLPYIKKMADFQEAISLISYNGAATLEWVSGKWKPTRESLMSRSGALKVLDLAKQKGSFVNIYTREGLHGYHPKGDFSGAEFYAEHTNAKYLSLVSDSQGFDLNQVYKQLMVLDPVIRNLYHDELFALNYPEFSLTKSNPEYLEFLPPGITKGKALASWLVGRGLYAEQLVAFGDAENDLDMLKLAGKGFAMLNASEGLKAQIENRTRFSCEQAGVAFELNALLAGDL